jgi:hypothetical protein
LEKTKKELDECTDTTLKQTLTEKLSLLDDQINKMLERKAELQEKENSMSKTLKLGKIE